MVIPNEADNIKEVWLKATKKDLEDYIAAGNSAGLKIVPISITVKTEDENS